jgi:hypothetical protein
MLRLPPGLCVVLLLGLLAGCGARNSQAPASVSGTVTYDGAPVPAGSITFHIENKGIYGAQLQSNGSYRITDMPDGHARVTVETESVNPKRKLRTYAGAKGAKVDKDYLEAMKKMGAPMKESPPQQYMPIPPAYAAVGTTPLTADIVAGSQSLRFDLTKSK